MMASDFEDHQLNASRGIFLGTMTFDWPVLLDILLQILLGQPFKGVLSVGIWMRESDGSIDNIVMEKPEGMEVCVEGMTNQNSFRIDEFEQFLVSLEY